MLSRIFLISEGKCCGRGCAMCPYTEKHTGTSNKVRKEVIDSLESWEKKELNSFLSKKKS